MHAAQSHHAAETHDADRSSRLSLRSVESRVHVKVPLVRQRHFRGLDRLRVRGDLKMASLRGRRMGKEKRRIDDEYAAKVKGVEKLVRRKVGHHHPRTHPCALFCILLLLSMDVVSL